MVEIEMLAVVSPGAKRAFWEGFTTFSFAGLAGGRFTDGKVPNVICQRPRDVAGPSNCPPKGPPHQSACSASVEAHVRLSKLSHFSDKRFIILYESDIKQGKVSLLCSSRLEYKYHFCPTSSPGPSPSTHHQSLSHSL